MMKSLLPRNWWVYAVSYLSIYVVVGIFCKPEFFGGKALHQGDGAQFEAMIHQSKGEMERTGEMPNWNKTLFSGMPNYATVGGVPVAYCTSIMTKLTGGFIDKDTLKASSLLFITICCAWVMFMSFRVHPIVAIGAAMAFAFTTYNVILIEVGHTTKLWGISFACLILGGMRAIFSGNRLIGGGIFILGLSFNTFGARHFQITYYFIFVALLYVISELYAAYKAGEMKKFALSMALMVGLAIPPAVAYSGSIILLNDYNQYSMRGKAELTPLPGVDVVAEGLDKDYAFEWSEGIGESFTLIIPYFYGGASAENISPGMETYDNVERVVGKQKMRSLAKNLRMPTYHGEQRFTEGPIYAGAIVCFLFVLGLLLLEKRTAMWIGSAALLTLMFAWGKNFSVLNYLLFDYFPGFNKFRSVSMAMSLTVLLMVLGAALGLQKAILMEWNEDFKKKLYIALGCTAGISLFMILGSSFMSFSKETDVNTIQSMFGSGNASLVSQMVSALESDRGSLLRLDAIRSAILIILAAGALVAAMTQKLKKEYALGIICVLMVGDLFFVAKRYLNHDSFVVSRKKNKKLLNPSEADMYILGDKDVHYRVFNAGNPFNEANTSYFHRSLGGYHPVKLRRMQDMIERGITPELQKLSTALRSGQPKFEEYGILNSLDARYIKFGEQKNAVIRNPGANGAAWFVNKLKLVQSADEEMQNTLQSNLRLVAIVNSNKYNASVLKEEYAGTGTVSIKEYNFDDVTYEVDASGDAFVVFSEIFYPDWQAYIDGKPIDHYQADYLLRGIEVPSGKHEVKFVFEAKLKKTLKAMVDSTFLFIMLLSISLLGGGIYQSTAKKDEVKV